jgi:hypothetical protein
MPELVRRMAESKLKLYCATRIPKHLRNEIRVSFKIRGDRIDLFEERAPWDDSSQWTRLRVAQIRYDPRRSAWLLYCLDRNEKLHAYTILEATADFDEVLAEIDRDPTGIFWG